MTPTDYQRAVLALLRGAVETDGDPVLYPVSFPAAGDLPPYETTVLRAPLPMDPGQPPLFFHASLGDSAVELRAKTGHEHQFVGIYETDAVELLRLVAAARHYDALVAPLDHGHTCPLDAREDTPLRRRGYSHVLLVGVDVYGSMIPALGEMRDAVVAGVPTRFLAALPITAEDLRVKKERGVPAVFLHWEAHGRDPFVILPSA